MFFFFFWKIVIIVKKIQFLERSINSEILIWLGRVKFKNKLFSPFTYCERTCWEKLKKSVFTKGSSNNDKITDEVIPPCSVTKHSRLNFNLVTSRQEMFPYNLWLILFLREEFMRKIQGRKTVSSILRYLKISLFGAAENSGK